MIRQRCKLKESCSNMSMFRIWKYVSAYLLQLLLHVSILDVYKLGAPFVTWSSLKLKYIVFLNSKCRALVHLCLRWLSPLNAPVIQRMTKLLLLALAPLPLAQRSGPVINWASFWNSQQSNRSDWMPWRTDVKLFARLPHKRNQSQSHQSQPLRLGCGMLFWSRGNGPKKIAPERRRGSDWLGKHRGQLLAQQIISTSQGMDLQFRFQGPLLRRCLGENFWTAANRVSQRVWDRCCKGEEKWTVVQQRGVPLV